MSDITELWFDEGPGSNDLTAITYIPLQGDWTVADAVTTVIENAIKSDGGSYSYWMNRLRAIRQTFGSKGNEYNSLTWNRNREIEVRTCVRLDNGKWTTVEYKYE